MQRAPRLAAFLIVATLAVPSAATTVLRLPVEEMARRADLVLRAEVVDVRVHPEPRDARPLSTDVTLRVLDVMKGQPTAPTLRLNLPGGVSRDAVVAIPGMPAFAPGEEVVLFLERTPRGFIPSGLEQGTFRVRRDVLSMPTVERRVRGLSRVQATPEGRLGHVEGADPEDAMDLQVLLDAVRRGASRAAGGAR